MCLPCSAVCSTQESSTLIYVVTMSPLSPTSFVLPLLQHRHCRPAFSWTWCMGSLRNSLSMTTPSIRYACMYISRSCVVTDLITSIISKHWTSCLKYLMPASPVLVSYVLYHCRCACMGTEVSRSISLCPYHC